MHRHESERTDWDNGFGPVTPEQLALEQSALERFLKKYPDSTNAPAEPAKRVLG